MTGVGAEGQVDHPDVEAGVVAVLHRPVDRGDHLRHVGGAVGGGDLDAVLSARRLRMVKAATCDPKGGPGRSGPRVVRVYFSESNDLAARRGPAAVRGKAAGPRLLLGRWAPP